MALQQWALPRLSELLPLSNDELNQIITYAETLSDDDAARHLGDMLGDSPQAADFIASFNEIRRQHASTDVKAAPVADTKTANVPSSGWSNPDSKTGHGSNTSPPPQYALPPGPPPAHGASRAYSRDHSNNVIEAARIRARDEQEMQQALMDLQYRYNIYNSDIEPEHETDYPCGCDICRYKQRKWQRYGVQDMWSKAVLYPGEKAYNDNTFRGGGSGIFSNNPYRFRVVSPFGYGFNQFWGPPRPVPSYYTRAIHQTISLNNQLNQEAQANVDKREPQHSIWSAEPLETAMSKLSVGDQKLSNEKRLSIQKQAGDGSEPIAGAETARKSRLSSFRKSIGIKSSEERAVAKVEKQVGKGNELRDQIMQEENSRWPDPQWRSIVMIYQEKVGMLAKITHLRERCPIQYLHLLKAGYFEPIPVAWADQASNPLKFSIEAAAGWRGITPAWRGYEDTAEERLYWVLNHREGSVGMRMKPDFISEMNMAQQRMASAVEPPPLYYSPNDTCRLQHTSNGYSKQVMPAPFQPFDRPEQPTDDTMILLDVSGSMDFDPVRPVYNEYLITGYARSTQPKNKDVAKAIIRRFTDAMANHDHQFRGYDLTTFSSHAKYIGTINHQNLDHMWRSVRIGGGTRVMTGWQKVKELHFQKHSQSATHHPVYGWQAGPETPMLRLLLLLDGEATDMDEFELDLLGLSWAHVTIFLIGVDGCPHHHRHANELQRISDVNHHVSFVDAQGNFPERFVTHELLKRHLGYEVSMQEFEHMEELPPYSAQ